jgi:hypothetical protein
MARRRHNAFGESQFVSRECAGRVGVWRRLIDVEGIGEVGRRMSGPWGPDLYPNHAMAYHIRIINGRTE